MRKVYSQIYISHSLYFARQIARIWAVRIVRFKEKVMITKQFIVAHFYPHTSPLAMLVGSARKFCRKVHPGAKEPKAGDHTTIIPTFRAPLDELRHFSMGLRIAKKLYGTEKSRRNEARTLDFNFFRNPGNDAFILNIELAPGYQEMIEECRQQLSGYCEWVYPLLDDVPRPHACIAEGEGLFPSIEPYLKQIHVNAPIVRFHLPFPKIMIKVKECGSTHWEEFDPEKQY